MDVLIVGGDSAVQEGVLQSVRSAGLVAEWCPDVPSALDAVAEGPPVALVVHADYARAGEELRHLAPAPGGAVIVFHDIEQAPRPIEASLGRAVIAELRLPLERTRLVALLSHLVTRARITGRDRRPPEPPVSP